MFRYLLLSILFISITHGQTKWGKCKIDKTPIYKCFDGGIKKKEFNKWYVAYECKNKEGKHYYWVADELISKNADTPFKIGLSLLGTALGTSQANHSKRAEDASEEIIPLIEDRKKLWVIRLSLLGICVFGVLIATAI